jgi:dolichyl-phosphate beta-glucosyltransferase
MRKPILCVVPFRRAALLLLWTLSAAAFVTSRRAFIKKISLQAAPNSDWSLPRSDKLPALTIVIPAYNEESRIEPTLRSYVEYVDRTTSSRWSNANVTILVVDDGSTDQTANTVRDVSESMQTTQCQIVCLSLPSNQGKGAALSVAMDHVTSTLVLTADADGSANIESLEGLFDALLPLLNETESDWWMQQQPAALVCGYRTYADTATGRRLFRWGFRTTVMTVCGDLRVRDTQCGFKLLTATAAKILYRNLHLPGWSHDVEVLYRAKILNISVAEAPVQWHDQVGSKLVAEGVIKVALRMFFDVCRCRVAYELGWWTV